MSGNPKKYADENEEQNLSLTEKSDTKVIEIALDDSDVHEHVAQFVRAVQETVAACRENVISQENARAAAHAIAELRRQVHRHRRTAHALKRLLREHELVLPQQKKQAFLH